MPVNINGSTGISGVDGSAGTPAIQGSDTNTGVFFGTNTIDFSTDGTSRLSIGTDGDLNVDSGTLFVDASTNRVGVGTSSPSQLLTVADTNGGNQRLQRTGLADGNASDATLLEFANGTGAVAELRCGGDGDLQINTKALSTDSYNNSLFIKGSTGNVGIGTTSPGAPLSVQANSTAEGIEILGRAADDIGEFAFLENDGTTEIGRIQARTTELNFRARQSGQSITFITGGIAERARIDSSGRLLVGTTVASVDTLFQITQPTDIDWCANLEHTTSSTSPLGLRIKYTASSPNNSGAIFLRAEDSTAIRAEFRSNGGLANFSANNVNLSDRNAKKNIVPAAGTWDCLKEWEIVNFRYKDQPDDADLNMGVIAQQVAESCPEVITVFQEATEDQPEKLGVKDQQMMWMAIKALQEAQIRIETLETRLTALEGGTN
jgi:hypothetical protein